MIELDKYEKDWILLIKGHYEDRYPPSKTWTGTLKPMFEEVYALEYPDWEILTYDRF